LRCFSDAGSVTGESYDYGNLAKNYSWTYGVGIRIDIPGFPIRFDYAMRLSRTT